MQYTLTGNNVALFNECLRISKAVLLLPSHHCKRNLDNKIVCEANSIRMEVFVNTKDHWLYKNGLHLWIISSSIKMDYIELYTIYKKV